MSGLAYICGYGYGSNSDDDEEYVPVGRKRQKLPAPDLSKVSVVPTDDHVDDPSLHGGRTRSFPHVRGNWVTFIFIKYPEDEDLLKLVAKLQLAAISVVDSCQRCDDIHVSLSKSLVLTYHLILPFTTSLQTALVDVESFQLGFDSIKIYCNEEKTRTFIALKANLFSNQRLQDITWKIDEVLGQYKLPTFYEDASFHMSILWVNGNKIEDLTNILPQLNDIVTQEIGKSLSTITVNQLHCKSGRVYINPNFQRNRPVIQTTSVHINPCFPQNANMPPVQVNKPKIFVNPNFVQTTSAGSSNYTTASTCNYKVSNECRSVASTSQNYSTNITRQTVQLCGQYSDPAITTSSNYSTVSTSSYPQYLHAPAATSHQLGAITVPSNCVQSHTKPTKLALPVTRSRYSLVRKNTPNTLQASDVKAADKVMTKLKINKYKTVTVNQLKTKALFKMDYSKENDIPQQSTSVLVEKIKRVTGSKTIRSRFKLVKRMNVTPVKSESKTTYKRRLSLNTSRINLKSKSGLKIVDKAKFKKNNVPCPLFKKFGKCLRASRGKCDFLHDRKHVAICRKFLQGACHNKECLLSHELTAKKMPTCYFYLKGMCTKEDCPYLHVKLNDKSKICTDFLKGYCENGEKCLKRHINMCPELASKGTCSSNQCPYPHRTKCGHQKTTNKTRNYKKLQTNQISTNDLEEMKNKNQTVSHKDESCDQKECLGVLSLGKDSSRYYKEVVGNESDTGIENIKPTRCKLGDLPSFIEL